MPRFEVKQSAKLNLTSYSGLALIGQCCQAAQVEAVIDPRLPVSQGMRSSDLVKSVVGLLSLGKSDFEAIEPFRGDRFFKEALGLAKVPGSVWMRQRLDARAAELRELTDELSLRLLERTEAPITAHKGYVCADLDTFVMDNSDTKKEAVSRTYQGVDGYTPIALYLGNEGWNLGLELRAGSHHSALETEYFFERAFPRLRRVCAADAKLLWRADSGFDSARLLFALADERDRWAALGRSFDYLTKWNPRRQDKTAWVDRAGRLKWVKGEVAFNFGKFQGQLLRDAVSSDPNFITWLLRSDFPDDTKQIVRDAVNGKFPAPPRVPTAP